MRYAPALLFLGLSGCDFDNAKPDGRYAMVYDATSSGVYVLDTRQGNVSHCYTALNWKTWCNPAVAVNGNGVKGAGL